MRVDNVNQSKKIGYIKFNNDTELDLISESLDRLIAKQQRLVDKLNGDREETQKLERFKEGKVKAVEFPKQQRKKLRDLRDKIKEKKIKEKGQGQGVKPEDLEEIEEMDIEDTEEYKNAAKVIAASEAGSGLNEGSEVTHRNMFVVVNALNEYIYDLEKDGLIHKTRRYKIKHERLQHLLEEAQQQKAQFERTTPKPRGWGRLRK